MLRMTQMLADVDVQGEALARELRMQAARRLRLAPSDIQKMEMIRRSLDARRGHAFRFSYTVDLVVPNEQRFAKLPNVSLWDGKKFSVQTVEKREEANHEQERPVVVGFGPSGIFAALVLARRGFCPIVIERGRRMDERVRDVERFFRDRSLDPTSNVQFGEGGAGTFSDGKLNTLNKDPQGIGRFVLETFVAAGAPEDILYDQKPHIGTDRLRAVITNLRKEIESLGGEVFFETPMTGLCRDGAWHVITPKRTFHTDAVFLGTGHSARDTYRMLMGSGFVLEPKPFAVGLRIEHPQSYVNEMQYRENKDHPALKVASYKLTSPSGAYTFCMCPGGHVVAAASVPETVVTNGMSNYAREGENANSALLVATQMSMDAQEALEKKAFVMGGGDGRAPAQTVGDFLASFGLRSGRKAFGALTPTYPHGVRETALKELWSGAEPLARGLLEMEERMPGFACENAVLTGVESRSSAPLRMVRDENRKAKTGIYPIGEGSGYAGGIMSSAIDGIISAMAYKNDEKK